MGYRFPHKRFNREAALRKAKELVAEVYQTDWWPDADVALIFLGKWAIGSRWNRKNIAAYNWYWMDRNKHQTMLFKREWKKGDKK